MSDEIDIASQALKPKKVAVDGQVAEFHSLGEQIDAQRQSAADEAAASTRRGLIINKLRPPGSI